MFRMCAIQLTVLSICLIPRAAAQAPADLDEAMRLRSQAVANDDGATWAKYTADDFTVVLPDGRLLNKAERLALMKTQKPMRNTPPDQVQIKHYGETYVRRFLGAAGRVIEVWTKGGDGKWRVSAVQVTSAAKK
jgi:ketosteroid isomerase-like protein